MRFLLKAAPPSTLRGRAIKSLQTKKKANTTKDNIVHSTTQPSNEIKAWGQHCSPNCGCTIRFETSLDSSTNQILSATYEARTIVTKVETSNNNDGNTHRTGATTTYLQPVLTHSRKPSHQGRPLIKSCKCDTLHGLAKTITKVLPTYTLPQAQNQLEYAGNRSSPAFRYTALKHLNLLNASLDSKTFANKNQNLDINSIPEGRCWDLVEEALTACIQGYIPKPRPSIQLQIVGKQDPRSETLQRIKHVDDEEREDKDDLDPLRFVRAAKRRAKEGLMQTLQHRPQSSSLSTSSSTTSSMPPFHLMSDSLHDHADTLTQLKLEIKSMQEKEDNAHESMNDWVSYVDEKQNKFSSASD